jgi:hypothetical protein
VDSWTVRSADQVAEVASARVRVIAFRPALAVTGGVRHCH